MGIFHDNFLYIRDSLSNLNNRSYSLQNLADMFGVKKLTVYGWLTQNKNPLNVSVQSVARNVTEHLGWKVTPEELLTENIRNKYNIEKKRDEKITLIQQIYVTNIVDFSKISRRLKNLREERGWSLKHVEKMVTKMFPHNPVFVDDNNFYANMGDEFDKGFLDDIHEIGSVRFLTSLINNCTKNENREEVLSKCKFQCNKCMELEKYYCEEVIRNDSQKCKD